MFVNFWLKGDTGITDIEAYLLTSMKAKIYDQFVTVQSKESGQSLQQYERVSKSLAYLETVNMSKEELHQLANKTPATPSLSRFDACNHQGISEPLQISGKTVEAHFARTLRRLRLRLNIS